MIKLKIGDNYLITSNKDTKSKDFIVYMMSNFEAHNKVALGFDCFGHVHSFQPNYVFDDYISAVKKDRVTELYILFDQMGNSKRNTMFEVTVALKGFISRLKETVPGINIKVVNIRKAMSSREFKASEALYDALRLDKRSILYHLDRLDEYKTFSTRYKNIPDELRVIDDTIKKMSKENKICDRKITLKDLEYLDLIDGATLNGEYLVLDIKPLPIYPSEPLGKCIGASDFKNNPYLFKAASYLYQGYHFGMVGTRIRINPQFRPEFIETLDHKFDDMFKIHNWSTIGYLHFGLNHLCGGEFNDVMAHTAEHGLEYFFISLKQYITTANMRDIAGRKVWWYPIYDDNGKMVYCAGLDILKDVFLRNLNRDACEEIKNMDLEQFLSWKNRHGLTFDRATLNFGDLNTSYSGSDDMFLEVCKNKDPELYEKIMKGAM